MSDYDNNSTTVLLDPVRDWDHVKGSADAPFTLVEYGDYECEDCGRLFWTLQKLQSELSSKLRLVYRNYPMSGVHHFAQLAAEAAEAAGAQGRFWEMHEVLFKHQRALKREDLIGYAKDLGLDTDRFKRELKEGTYAEAVRKNFIAGVKNGVNGTPGLFLNGVREQGVLDEARVRGLLSS
ncbi:MAG TPA: thioredoxin domain-containing protein [Bryobacteraceae bacterium]|jgi:protein-disulfide isomerase